MTADVLDGLRALRELLADPDHWTQGANARDEDGNEVELEGSAACQWCLYGGIAKVASDPAAPTSRIVRALQDQIPASKRRDDLIEPLVGFNDSSTHDEVVAAIDRAILDAEKRVAA